MRPLLIFGLLLLATRPVFAQEVPMGCFVRDYSQEHLRQHPEQVVDRMSIFFRHKESFVEAEIKVLLADQGHAAREGYGGKRMIEWAGDFSGPLTFSVECDGGFFEVLGNDAEGLLIETRYLRISTDGCGGEGQYTTLAEDGSAVTRYRLQRAVAAACEW